MADVFGFVISGGSVVASSCPVVRFFHDTKYFFGVVANVSARPRNKASSCAEHNVTAMKNA